jgi:signal recognition particle subunit SEC65
MVRTNVLVYPVYIDSTLKRSGGRKISKEDGVPNPNPNCMARAACALGFVLTLEPVRCHPRNFWSRGRLIVNFFTEDHQPKKPAIPTRIALYKAIAAKVKELGNTPALAPPPPPKTGKLVGSEKSRLKRQAAKKK